MVLKIENDEEAIVQIKNLTKVIKGKKIIDDISLDLYKGQITGFLGPNGSGKTTTIRMMAGLMKPTSGEVFINGMSVQKDFTKAIEKAGMIVENPEMYKYLTGYQNLLHFARMHKDVSKQRIDEVTKQVGLEKRINEKVSTYSLGMKQRLGLAQALLNKPNFLILDEPTNGLDPSGIRELRMYLRKIATEDGVAIFISSHMLAEIELICDRIAVIQSGRIIDVRDVTNAEVSVFEIEVSNPSLAKQVVGECEVFENNNTIVVDVEKNDVPDLVEKLMNANVKVYTIVPKSKTLEEQFIEITGGTENDSIN